MKSPGDKLGIQNLAKQLYPGNTAFFLKAYADATEKPYSYLIVDISMETPDNMRLRTDIFRSEAKYPVIYNVPANKNKKV